MTQKRGRIPTPGECGLPEEFSHWRATQEQAMEFLMTCPKRVKALCIPTGGGKSPLVVGDALRSKKPTCIVTHSRALQDQYESQYRSVGMVDLRGRSNYPCHMRPDVIDYTCQHGYATRCTYKGTYECPASAAEMRAATSSLVVTNYEKWIQSRKFGMGLQHIERVVFDEGHESFNALAKAMQVTLHQHEIEEVLKLDFPDHHESQFFSEWRRWAQVAREVARSKMQQAERRLEEGKDPKGSWVKLYTHLRNLVRRLSILATANPANWIVEEVQKGYQFDPVQPGRYVESALLLKVPDVTVISATLILKTMFMVGIGQKDFELADYPSEFDPARCPIYYVPTMRVDSKAPDLGLLWSRLDQAGARRRDRNGLVHTISFTRREEVVQRSRILQEARSKGKLYYNERGEPATETIADFVDAYPGAILVSPSVGQGFDFHGSQAEWQMICKIPFPPPSKILKARCEPEMGGDEDHAKYLAWQKFVQMAGRLMRSKTDQSETFLFDDHLRWFRRYSYLAPKSFHQFFREVPVLPPPPERLRPQSLRG